LQLQTEAGIAAAAVALEDERKRRLLMKVKKTQQLLAAAAHGHVPPETAARATLIAAAVIATGHPRAKTHWPLVVPGMPAGIFVFLETWKEINYIAHFLWYIDICLIML
jgi:hypothetical protein